MSENSVLSLACSFVIEKRALSFVYNILWQQGNLAQGQAHGVVEFSDLLQTVEEAKQPRVGAGNAYPG